MVKSLVARHGREINRSSRLLVHFLSSLSHTHTHTLVAFPHGCCCSVLDALMKRGVTDEGWIGAGTLGDLQDIDFFGF